MTVLATTSLDELVEQLGDRVVTDPDRLAAYSTDSSRAEPAGLPSAAVVATSTSDVASALTWAHRHRVPVSVRGSGTGLTGGAVAYHGGLVVSLAAMTKIKTVDPANQLAEVEAGVITADIDRAAAAYGLLAGCAESNGGTAE